MLRENIASSTVDLVYLDPPFNSQATYNVLFRSPAGKSAEAQIEAFEDTWHWGEESEHAYDDVLNSANTNAAEMLRAMRGFLGENDMMAYLAMMAVRLLELHRVLKPTGSLYLHCDPTASHYLKLLLDAIFGATNFRNEIVWKRTSAHNSARRWGPVHDVIFFYTASDNFSWTRIFQPYNESYTTQFYRYEDANGSRFRVGDLTGAGVRHGDSGTAWKGVNPTAKGRHWAAPRGFPEGDKVPKPVLKALDYLDSIGRIYWPANGGVPGFKRYLDDMEGVQIQDIVGDIPPLSPQAKERLGYSTQKPLALLERIINASSNPGDVILDPFCGCGTAVHAAQKRGRQWIGIDVTCLAIGLIERRLKDAFPGITFEVLGTPKTLQDAVDLAERDKYQFQWWAASAVGGRPYAGKKKGADGGIDGILFFRSGAKTTESVIISVKGGNNVGVGAVRDLHSVIEREKAAIGVLISAVLPTAAMRKEAAAVGLYDCGLEEKFPRLQLITLAELFQGKRPRIPLIDTAATFRTAAREDLSAAKQGKLDI